MVNEGKDSVVMYGCPIGEAVKDGYWIYQEIVITHLRDKPLIQRVYKIEKKSPDSLYLYNYDVVNKEKFTKIYERMPNKRSFEMSDLKDANCPRYMKKVDQVTFEANSSVCPFERRGRMTWMDSEYQYEPNLIVHKARAYLEQDKPDSTQYNRTVLKFKRLSFLQE